MPVSSPQDISVQSADAARTVQLARRWRNDGDRQAREQLFVRFLPLARKLAGRYPNAREPREDLVQVASIGLLGAIDRFDPDLEIRFSSFAVPTILGELKRYFRDLGWAVHVPRGAQELAVKVEDAQQKMSARHGRAPTVHELSQYLELELADVLDALETARAHHASSLDAPHDDGEGESGSVVDSFGREDPDLQIADDRVTVGEAARHLSKRERDVLGLRFVEDLTQTQIAERIGVSQMQVSRILRRAISRLGELAADGAASS